MLKEKLQVLNFTTNTDFLAKLVSVLLFFRMPFSVLFGAAADPHLLQDSVMNLKMLAFSFISLHEFAPIFPESLGDLFHGRACPHIVPYKYFVNIFIFHVQLVSEVVDLYFLFVIFVFLSDIRQFVLELVFHCMFFR